MPAAAVDDLSKILDVSYEVYNHLNEIDLAFIRLATSFGMRIEKSRAVFPKVSEITEVKKTKAPLAEKLALPPEARAEEQAQVPQIAAPAVIGEEEAEASLSPVIKETKPLSKPVTGGEKLRPLASVSLPSEVEGMHISTVVPKKGPAPEPKRPVPLAATPALGSMNLPGSTMEDTLSAEDLRSVGTSELKTPIQQLLKLVETKGPLTISDAARILNVDKTLVQAWAKILNSSDLLKIRYPVIGEPMLEV